MLPSNIHPNAHIMQAPNSTHLPLWTQYFNPAAAAAELYRHVATRASSNTGNTLESYQTSLAMWNAFAGDQLPTSELIQSYIFYLQHTKWLKPSSIMARLAPVRAYLKFLSKQPTIGYRGDER
nr:hypothetical protein [Anaerolineae bacterium]